MKTQFIVTAILLATSMSIFSCKKKKEEDPKAALNVATSYDASNYVANTTKEAELVKSFDDLSTEISKGSSTSYTFTYSTINTLYNSGTPSLASITDSKLSGFITTSGGWIESMVDASGNTWTPATPTVSSKGGVYNASGSKKYLFDEYGIQHDELIKKVLMNCSFYNYFNTIAKGNLDLAAVDKMLKVYGAHPNFVNSYDKVKHATDYDNLAANYAGRRDDNSGTGFYLTIKQNFLVLQSAIKSGSDYNADRDAAIANIKKNWEMAMLASVVNYANSASASLSKTTVTDDDKAAALHSISEAIGFTLAWYGVPQADRTITDAQISELLGYLEFTLNGTSVPTANTYLFVTNITPSQIAKLTTLSSKIKSIYSFTDAQMLSFNTNWVTTQAR